MEKMNLCFAIVMLIAGAAQAGESENALSKNALSENALSFDKLAPNGIHLNGKALKNILKIDEVEPVHDMWLLGILGGRPISGNQPNSELATPF